MVSLLTFGAACQGLQGSNPGSASGRAGCSLGRSMQGEAKVSAERWLR